MAFDIITMGSATVDVFAKTDSQVVKIVSDNEEKDFIAYPLGSKLLVSDLDFLIGGGGTNTAVSFSRLGFKTGFIGKIGRGPNSKRVLSLLEREHISFLGVHGKRTGYSIVLDSIEHDRTILTFKGSNDTLSFEEIDFSTLQTKWFYASSMIQQSFETLIQVAKTLKNTATSIAFNPSNYQAEKGYNFLKDMLLITDILVLNKEEAQLLLDAHASIQELAEQLTHFDTQIVVVTDAENGAACRYKGQTYTITPSKDVSVIETTGAGDAFASAFVAAQIKKYSIQDSLRFAMVQAQSVISHNGAKKGLLTYEDVLQKIRSFSGQVTVNSASQTKRTTRTIHDSTFANNSTFTNPFTQEVDEGKEFVLSNGKQLRSLQALDSALKFMSEDVFVHHVSLTHNHFATWVQDVFGFSTLAKNMKQCSTKIGLRAALNTFMHSQKM